MNHLDQIEPKRMPLSRVGFGGEGTPLGLVVPSKDAVKCPHCDRWAKHHPLTGTRKCRDHGEF